MVVPRLFLIYLFLFNFHLSRPANEIVVKKKMSYVWQYFPPDLVSALAPVSEQNSTLPLYTLRPVEPLLPGISDFHLSLLAPLAAFWLSCLFFYWLDESGFLQQYRLHASAEELARNTITRAECLRVVLINQTIQTVSGYALGMLAGGQAELTGQEEYDIALWILRIKAARETLLLLLSVTGIDFRTASWDLLGLASTQSGYSIRANSLDSAVARLLYWFVIPAAQFFVASFVTDTWQYFTHRWLHTNKWLYSKVARNDVF